MQYTIVQNQATTQRQAITMPISSSSSFISDKNKQKKNLYEDSYNEELRDFDDDDCDDHVNVHVRAPSNQSLFAISRRSSKEISLELDGLLEEIENDSDNDNDNDNDKYNDKYNDGRAGRGYDNDGYFYNNDISSALHLDELPSSEDIVDWSCTNNNNNNNNDGSNNKDFHQDLDLQLLLKQQPKQPQQQKKTVRFDDEETTSTSRSTASSTTTIPTITIFR